MWGYSYTWGYTWSDVISYRFREGLFPGYIVFVTYTSNIFAHINKWCQLCLLSFILSSFYFLAICANSPFLLVPLGEILMPSPRSRSRVCSAGWDTVAVAADPASDTPGRGLFLCRPFLGGRRKQSLCSEPTVSVPPGVGHGRNFLILPSSPFFPTSPLSQMSP